MAYNPYGQPSQQANQWPAPIGGFDPGGVPQGVPRGVPSGGFGGGSPNGPNGWPMPVGTPGAPQRPAAPDTPPIQQYSGPDGFDGSASFGGAGTGAGTAGQYPGVTAVQGSAPPPQTPEQAANFRQYLGASPEQQAAWRDQYSRLTPMQQQQWLDATGQQDPNGGTARFAPASVYRRQQFGPPGPAMNQTPPRFLGRLMGAPYGGGYGA